MAASERLETSPKAVTSAEIAGWRDLVSRFTVGNKQTSDDGKGKRVAVHVSGAVFIYL